MVEEMMASTLTIAITTIGGRLDYVEEAAISANISAREAGAGVSVLLVDNSDDSGISEKLKELSSKHGLGYCSTSHQLSMAENWNFAVKSCDSTFVTILHDDDLIGPNYLSRAMELIRTNSTIDCIVAHSGLIDEAGESTKGPKYTLSPDGLLIQAASAYQAKIAKECYFRCPGFIFSRAVYESVGGFSNDFSIFIDHDFFIRLAKYVRSVGEIHAPDVKYRLHSTNAGKSPPKVYMSDVRVTMERIQRGVYDFLPDQEKTLLRKLTVERWVRIFRKAKLSGHRSPEVMFENEVGLMTRELRWQYFLMSSMPQFATMLFGALIRWCPERLRKRFM